MGIGPLVLGIGIAAALIAAVSIGIRVRSREPAPPDPKDQPKLPDSGPVEQEYSYREPDEIEPRSPDERLYPHEIKATGTSRPSDRSKRPKWRPGRSGGFGSGSFG
ncbi:hypothetical protein G5C51_39285 [Streptomyces sp. A7024]|uniref:Secreted protein n=1 Tax=Streptomyces coryli TaxID=1128680 RepID=A0A6G4UCH5_9ACTN|nr:hypothetical protein [Streptomyces coryli]